MGDLVKWNTWLGEEWRCDGELYDGMGNTDKHPVSVGVEDSDSTASVGMPSPEPTT